jgi:glycosyltransferase involved in cell wall biosynthesis
MIKICHTISGLSVKSGGPSFFLSSLLKQIHKNNNYNNYIIFYSDNSDIKIPINNSFLIKRDKLYFSKLGYIPNYFKDILPINLQIIHCHGLWQYFIIKSYYFSKRHKIKFIISPHGMLEPWSLKQNWLVKKISFYLYQKKILNHASCIHATSLMEANNIKKLGFKNIAIIPNGIDINEYNFKNSNNLYNNDELTFLFISRIHHKKGIEILINSLFLLRKNCDKKFKLHIYGDGNIQYIDKINLLIKMTKMDDLIFVHKPIYGSLKINLLQNSDILILPSFSENFGNVIAEALSCGTPVITTNKTPWTILNITNSGWCIDVGITPLYNLLIKIINIDKKTLNFMSINARKLACDQFSISKTSNMHLKMYDWVHGNSNKPDFIV